MRRALIAAILFGLAGGGAAAEDNPSTAPGGEINPVGVSGVYACTVGDAAEAPFRIARFADGQFHIEMTSAGRSIGLARYSWQLATATLYRERVTAEGASKFRRLNGSLRTLHELIPGHRVAADYAEARLDGASPAVEWRYEIAVGRRAASYGPNQIGEIEILPVEETRITYVDAQGQPLPLARASEGFERREHARIAFAPSLGVALRVERTKADGGAISACSLASYTRP